MPSRVNLSVPPRLIESARAAQYANREVLDGRVLSEKIKAKTKARRAAASRQQTVTTDRAGGTLESVQAEAWRIWRKRRTPGLFRTYTIEKSREIFPVGNTAGPTYTSSIVDAWTVFVEGDEIEGKQVFFQRFIPYNGFHAPQFSSPVDGTERSRLYLSLFSDPETGSTLDPTVIIAYQRTVNLDVLEGNSWVTYPWTKATYDGFVDRTNPQFDPVHAWDPVLYNAVVNFYPPPGAQIALPIEPEYDLTRISLAPGYERTIFSELP